MAKCSGNYTRRFFIILVVLLIVRNAKSIRLGAQYARRIPSHQLLTSPNFPNPTGYPAAGITPKIPFELPGKKDSFTEKPQRANLQPDVTYGSPKSPGETYLPPETGRQPLEVPSTAYGTPWKPNKTYRQPDKPERGLSYPGKPSTTYGIPHTNEDDTNMKPDNDNNNKEEESYVHETSMEQLPNEGYDELEEDEEEENKVVVEYAPDGSVIAISTAFQTDFEIPENNKAKQTFFQRFPQPKRRRQPPTSESLQTDL